MPIKKVNYNEIREIIKKFYKEMDEDIFIDDERGIQLAKVQGDLMIYIDVKKFSKYYGVSSYIYSYYPRKIAMILIEMGFYNVRIKIDNNKGIYIIGTKIRKKEGSML